MKHWKRWIAGCVVLLIGGFIATWIINMQSKPIDIDYEASFNHGLTDGVNAFMEAKAAEWGLEFHRATPHVARRDDGTYSVIIFICIPEVARVDCPLSMTSAPSGKSLSVWLFYNDHMLPHSVDLLAKEITEGLRDELGLEWVLQSQKEEAIGAASPSDIDVKQRE